MANITLYGNPGSTCTRRVLMTLAEKKAQAELVTLDLQTGDHKKPEHLKRQPFGVVPALEHDGFSIYESRAIMRYLDAVLPGVKLTPPEPRALGRMEQWISVEQSYFSAPALTVIKQLYFSKLRGGQPDLDVVAKARGDLERTLDILERSIAPSATSEQPFLAGDRFTLADITFMPYVEYLFPAGVGDVIAARPALSAWWQRVSHRPTWIEVAGKRAV